MLNTLCPRLAVEYLVTAELLVKDLWLLFYYKSKSVFSTAIPNSPFKDLIILLPPVMESM